MVPPILHLSIPVHDLGAARQFYVECLGCGAARSRPGFADIWFFGMQVTFQDRPDQCEALSADGVRHFGVTLDRRQFDQALSRLNECGVRFLTPVATDDPGTPMEQTKVKFADPSGNVIEFKTYVDVESALELGTDRFTAVRQER